MMSYFSPHFTKNNNAATLIILNTISLDYNILFIIDTYLPFIILT